MHRKREDSRDRRRNDRSSRDKQRDREQTRDSKNKRQSDRPKRAQEGSRDKSVPNQKTVPDKLDLQTEPSPYFQVYVTGFGQQTTKQELEEVFDRYGTVKGVHLKIKYAFIEFEKEFEAEEAILGRNGILYKGQRLKVTKARGVKKTHLPKQPKADE